MTNPEARRKLFWVQLSRFFPLVPVLYWDSLSLDRSQCNPTESRARSKGPGLVPMTPGSSWGLFCWWRTHFLEALQALKRIAYTEVCCMK